MPPKAGYAYGISAEIIENLVVFEGGDGSGTSTQLSLLGRRFPGPGLPAFFATAEPSGGAVGKLIRQALSGDPGLRPETLAMLFAADRNEHLHAEDGIRARCGRGELVVCDRYVLSSLVYQGIQCGERLPRLLNSGFPAPGLVLHFDLDPEEAVRRMSGRSKLDVFENLDFQIKVRGRYLSLLDECREAGSRVRTVDASRSPEEVAAEVWRELAELPIMKANG